VTYARTIAILQLLFLLGIVVPQGSEAIQSIEPIKTVVAGGANPIEITKTIGTFDGINNTLTVLVDLKYLGRYPVDIGYIDYSEDSNIINCSGYKIISKIINIYNDSIVPTNQVNLEPSSIQFYIHNLYPKERVRFSYTINTEHRTDFLTYTTIRFYSEDGYPDSDYIFKISTMPAFSVVVKTNELEALINKAVELTYDIQYLGPANVGVINVSFDSSSAYIFSNHDIRIKVSKGEISHIPITIIYKNEGIYRLPGININGIHYNDNRTITITNASTNMYYAVLPYWAALVSILTLVPGVVALISFFERRKKQETIIKQRIKKKWLK
jgi:hypothetical protein